MDRQPVELQVGGQTYRVVASAEEAELKRLADVVDGKLRELAGPNRAVAPQALLLAAIALAHELEEERAKRRAVEESSREKLKALLARIDAALDASEEAAPKADAPEHDAPSF